MYVYKTRGTCSKAIEIELDGDTVKSAYPVRATLPVPISWRARWSR